jgi:hypothetical protein
VPRYESPVPIARDEKDAGGVFPIALRVLKSAAIISLP